MRNTKQKDAIIKAIDECPTHPTAEAVYAASKAWRPHISMGTVYRNLNAFAGEGALRRIRLPEAGDRYDTRLDPHEHMLCESCGAITDIEIAFDFASLLPKSGDFRVTGHQLIVFGLCTGCKGEMTSH